MPTPSETLAQARQVFHGAAKECERFAVLSRSSRLQSEHAGRLRDARLRVSVAKKALIDCAAEDGANELLAFEFMLDALANELDMYAALKRDDPGAAWTKLVNAQMAALHAVRSHAVAAHLEQAHIPRLHVIEQLMFPKQMFMSVGLIVEHAVCSICSSVYGDCEHVKGRPYMGQMCACIITKSTLLETSLVEDPANKHCRILSITDKNGVATDPLSLEPAEPMPPNPAHTDQSTRDSFDV
jgi:hypothetical protein